MKKYLFILLVFAACSKGVDITTPVKHELITETLQPTFEQAMQQLEKESVLSLRPITNPGKGKGKNKPPTDDPTDTTVVTDPPGDTTIITDPPADTTVYTDPTTATVCLYYDFDGHLQTNGDWVYGHPSGQPFYTEPAGLTPAKEDMALDVSRYDCREYRVLITKDEFIYNNFPGKKTRIIVTPRHWTNYGTTGLAYPYSLATGFTSTCYVFSGALYGSGEWIGKIGTHESGHTFGLQHQKLYGADGTLINNYRYGCNMGQCYNEQGYWIYGMYWFNMYQDDNAVLKSIAGLR